MLKNGPSELEKAYARMANTMDGVYYALMDGKIDYAKYDERVTKIIETYKEKLKELFTPHQEHDDGIQSGP